MPIIKYINRLKRMDDLIRKKATGNPEQFAEKMGMNRSSLMRHLSEIKSLGAPIYFDPIKQSYYYEENVELEIGFRRIPEKKLNEHIGAGRDSKNCSVSIYETQIHQFRLMFNF